MENTDRIERSIVIRAPRARIWRTLTDSEEFGTWFRAKLHSGFAVGQRVAGQITYPGSEHYKFEALVEKMEPESLFSFRWPHEIDPKVGPSWDASTLVEFRLEEVEGGTKLTVTESGFDRLPAGMREEAFRNNSKGWTIQVENVRSHVEG